MNWWEIWPERYQTEIEKLAENDWNPKEVTTKEQEEYGMRVVQITYTYDGVQYPIKVCFPPEYPFFKGYAYLSPDNITLSRHHNPISGELCLLAGQTGWQTQTYMADLLFDHLNKIFVIANAPSSTYAVDNEEPQGEPYSGYLSSHPDSVFLVPDISMPSEISCGNFFAHRLSSPDKFRFALTKVLDIANYAIDTSPELLRSFGSNVSVQGYWKKIDITSIDDVRQLDNPQELCRLVNENLFKSKCQGTDEFLFAAVFEQEVRQGVYSTAWRTVHLNPSAGKRKRVSQGRKKTPARAKLYEATPLKFEDFRTSNRLIRIPEVSELGSKSVCIVGCGMLGSTIAIKLAQAGINKLYLIDNDTIDATTSVRYALGLQYSGLSKVHALHSYIQANYPFTAVEPIYHAFGTPIMNEHGQLAMQALDEADIIVDAAAEQGVSYFLSHRLNALNAPSVVVTTRPGTWGGEVWNLTNPEGPCWSCLQRYQHEKTLPMPNGDDSGSSIQPGGCNALTTEGYGFESDLISLHAVRTVIGSLTSETGFPAVGWHAMNINLRNDKNTHSESLSLTFAFDKHPDCPCHSR
ncbi:ThiF family adenylyltransferase [Vibrio parahaemolyticus]